MTAPASRLLRAAVLAPLLLLTSCSGPRPDTAAKAWVTALSKGDMPVVTELTCSAAQKSLTTTGGVLKLIEGAVDQRVVEAIGSAQPRFSADALQYRVHRNDGANAEVEVQGQVRIAILLASMAHDVKFTMRMVKEKDQKSWQFCP